MTFRPGCDAVAIRVFNDEMFERVDRVLSRLGLDPAFGSGPVATLIQDVLTIIIYFTVMTSLFPGGT